MTGFDSLRSAPTEVISWGCSCTVLLPHVVSPGVRQITGWMGWFEKAQTPLWVMLWECDEPAKWLLLQAYNSIYMLGQTHSWVFIHFWVTVTFWCTRALFFKKLKSKCWLTEFWTHVLNNRWGGTVWGHTCQSDTKSWSILSHSWQWHMALYVYVKPLYEQVDWDRWTTHAQNFRLFCYTDTPWEHKL